MKSADILIAVFACLVGMVLLAVFGASLLFAYVSYTNPYTGDPVDVFAGIVWAAVVLAAICGFGGVLLSGGGKS